MSGKQMPETPTAPAEPPPPYPGLESAQHVQAPAYTPPKYFSGPSQAGYVPVGPTSTTTTTVIITQPTLGPLPMSMVCPKCHAQIVTETTAQAGTLAWLICILLAVFGCWCGCCLIPFCVDDCQDIEHRCPNCKQHLGSHRRL